MFKGSLVALVTPMQENGDIDYAGLTRLVDFHLENQTDGLVVLGTTGESATITADEKKQIIRQVVEQVAGKLPVIAGTGATATSTTIELTQQAMELGVDACLLMAPAYVKPTQEGLFQHFKTVAQAVPLPQIIYNIPGRTVCDILPDTFERLAQFPNIIGVKEATGDVKRSQEILQRCGDALDIYSGDDNLAMVIIAAGGKGVVSVTANIAPREMHQLCAATLAGDMTQAEQLNQQLAALHKALFVESNPIPIKWALAEKGLIPAGIRLPLTPLAAEHQPALRDVLQQTGVI